ncbi:hypothetical protein [Nocardia sp. alder85J]|nr:hypothetical protein [Nocardia sp. alder85J]MCX4091381.1 hypothetical protein [Nocardia sp. alder85J]
MTHPGIAAAADVDVTRLPRAEWRQRNEAAGIGVFRHPREARVSRPVV